MEEGRRGGANQISGKWGSVICRRYSTPSEHSLCLFRNCYYWLWYHCVCFASFLLSFTLPSLPLLPSPLLPPLASPSAVFRFSFIISDLSTQLLHSKAQEPPTLYPSSSFSSSFLFFLLLMLFFSSFLLSFSSSLFF